MFQPHPRGCHIIHAQYVYCFAIFFVLSQEPWPSLSPLLLWALLFPEGPLCHRWTLSAGCPSGGSQGACQSSPAWGLLSAEHSTCTQTCSSTTSELINKAMLYVKGMTCVGSRSSCQYMLHMHKSYIYILLSIHNICSTHSSIRSPFTETITHTSPFFHCHCLSLPTVHFYHPLCHHCIEDHKIPLHSLICIRHWHYVIFLQLLLVVYS